MIHSKQARQPPFQFQRHPLPELVSPFLLSTSNFHPSRAVSFSCALYLVHRAVFFFSLLCSSSSSYSSSSFLPGHFSPSLGASTAVIAGVVTDTVESGSVTATAPGQVARVGGFALLIFRRDGSGLAVAVPAKRKPDVLGAHFVGLFGPVFV